MLTYQRKLSFFQNAKLLGHIIEPIGDIMVLNHFKMFFVMLGFGHGAVNIS